MSLFNLPIIVKFLGVLLTINGVAMFLTALPDFYYQENMWKPLLLSSFISLGIGTILFSFGRKANKQLNTRDGYLIVSLGWLILTFSGALPYILSNFFLPENITQKNILSITNCIFESVSGYTTTGATLLNNIELMPKTFLLWRSTTQWIGGMGIIVLTIAILPLLGIGGMKLFVAEAPGISNDKLHPRITHTAKRLWIIYVLLTLVLVLFLWISGMNIYNAVNHAFTTMSTGGFSTKNASISFWNHSPILQYIIILFMGISSCNFILIYYVYKGNFLKTFQNTELKYYLGIIIACTLIITVNVYLYANPNLSTIHYTGTTEEGMFTPESSFRHSLFQVVSIISTTGYITADYTLWNTFAALIIFALFFVGGMAGSTSGGVKVVRHVILVKNSWNEFKKMLKPNAVIPLRFGDKSISQEIIYKVLAFFITYMLIFMVGSILISYMYIENVPKDSLILSSLSLTASSLGNIGPAFGEFGPTFNYGNLTTIGKWFSAFLMLLGRLELFTVLILFTPFFWKR